MGKILRKDTDTKKLKRIILKHSKDISTYNDRLRGVFSIKNIRIYDIDSIFKKVEVDIEFKGEIYAQLSSIRGDEWIDSKILTNDKFSVSKVRLNRFFKRRLLNDVKHRLSYFNEDIFHDSQIKKIKWI
jgi:hypothetical protein